MKPDSRLRDLLLARHASAEASLDRLRRAALPATAPPAWRTLLRELYFPQRRAWQALAAVWMGLALFHLAARWRTAPPARSEITVAALNAWLNQSHRRETFAQTDLHR